MYKRQIEYRMAVEPPAVYLPVEPVVARGGTRDLSFVLRRGHVAMLRFVDEDGKPLALSLIHISEPTRPY